MKIILKTTLAAVMMLAFVAGVFAAEYTKGTVKKVNMESKKVTIIHEELVNLGMPAMTMVFRTATPEMLEKMKVGEQIEFVAGRVKGKITVVELKE